MSRCRLPSSSSFEFFITPVYLWMWICLSQLQDESGHVSPTEFGNALERFGLVLSPDDLKKFFRSFDNDKSGSISYDEFVEAVFGEE